MKKIKNKFLLAAFGTASLSVPIIVVSCTAEAETKIRRNYDLGLATNPINNLNYIKFRSLDRVLPSLVDPFVFTGPTTELRAIIPTNKLTASIISPPRNSSTDFFEFFKASEKRLEADNGFGLTSGGFWSISDFDYIGGLIRSSGDDVRTQSSMFWFSNPRNSNNYQAVTGLLNKGLSTWSNGDVISAKDLQDYVQYILDYNTGSQKLEELIKMNIRGANEFLDAQRAYSVKFNKNYINPFGRRKYIKAPWDNNVIIQDPKEKVYQSQTKDENGKELDTEEVENIKKAALNLGFYTSQIFLDFTNEEIANNISLPENNNFSLNNEIQNFVILRNEKKVTVTLLKNPYVNPLQKFDPVTLLGVTKTLGEDHDAFTLIFDKNGSQNIVGMLTSVLPKLYPVNRKHIETEGGGIQKYGSDPDKFLTASAFKISNINLGPQGFIELEKNDAYFTASNTLSNKIKIFFQTDPTVSATWFEDGIIQQALVPANRINTFFSDLRYRPLLKKNAGFGTIALGFNLDYETKGDSPLQDPDLRKAIYYATNREDVLKTVGWDFSFPVNTWTSFGSHKTSEGLSLELFFNEEKTSSEDGKTFDLQNNTQFTHLAKNFEFERTDRTDKLYSVETAKFYIERFKKNHPDLKQVTLEFLNNSTDEQIKAGIYFTQAIKETFGDFLNIDVRSLPENTYAAFIEEGKYDIIYQNYDRLGGTAVYDYVGVFFSSDEIDSYASINIGFKNNPVGSFTYADWISQLYSTKTGVSMQKAIEPYLNFVNGLSGFSNDLEELKRTEFNTTKRVELVNKYRTIIKDTVTNDKTNTGIFEFKTLFTDLFISNLLEYAITPVNNIKLSRLKRLYNQYLSVVVKLSDIQEMTSDTAKRILIPRLFWDKIVELSYKKINESSTMFTSRIAGFFSGNFSDEDIKNVWTNNKLFELVGYFEKIIRETVPVIPLAEVDTNWEITTVGGVSSLFTYNLQYAYDFTNPPRPGLPRKNRG